MDKQQQKSVLLIDYYIYQFSRELFAKVYLLSWTTTFFLFIIKYDK